MIRHIHSLKKELYGHPLLLWDTGKRSMQIMLRFALRGIKVNGFIAAVPRFVSESILGQPVLSPENASGIDTAIIVVDDHLPEKDISNIRKYGHTVQYSECLESDPRLSAGPVYIYGTGQDAWSFIKEAELHSVNIAGFISSSDEHVPEIMGKPVYRHIGNIPHEGFSVVVPSVMPGDRLHDIEASGFTGDVFISELSSDADLMSTDTLSMLANAVWDKKRIYICHDGPLARDLLHRVLSTYSIPLTGEVTIPDKNTDGLPDIYSLLDEDIDSCVLLFHSFSAVNRSKIVEAAVSIGFREGTNVFSSLDKSVYNMRFLKKALQYEKDTRMGISMDYSDVGGLRGWAKYGEDSDDAVRIMVLGGSTSSEVYFPENWVSKLYRSLSSREIRTVIYNGAYEMDDVSKEFSRMCRDIHFLAPDIIVSMSGLNDTTKKPDIFDHMREENALEYWMRMQYYMSIIAHMENATLLSFLQPSNISMSDASLRESLFFIRDSNKTNGPFEKKSVDDDFYINLLNLFRHRDGKYIDFCHYSDEANSEIAEVVRSEILSLLQE